MRQRDPSSASSGLEPAVRVEEVRSQIMNGSRAIGVAVGAAALVLTGCGGSDPESGGASTSGPSSSATRTLVESGDILSGAARYGDLVFTSGFLGLAEGEDFAADVNDALDQLEATLITSGAGFDTLLKVNVYLLDWDDWEVFNQVYQERIGKFGRPPRTTVEVSRLGLDAPIEIAAIAHTRPATP